MRNVFILLVCVVLGTLVGGYMAGNLAPQEPVYMVHPPFVQYTSDDDRNAHDAAIRNRKRIEQFVAAGFMAGAVVGLWTGIAIAVKLDRAAETGGIETGKIKNNGTQRRGGADD